MTQVPWRHSVEGADDIDVWDDALEKKLSLVAHLG
jgi:hypothetical protein